MVEVFEIFWSHLLSSLPLLFAYIAGIVACSVSWWRSPRASSFALAGLTLLLVEQLGGTAVTAWIIHAAHTGDPADLGTRLRAAGLLRGFVFAAGMGLLLVSVFADRPPRPLTETSEGPDWRFHNSRSREPSGSGSL